MFEKPWCSGKFHIAAGLRPLGEGKVFPPEENLPKYIENIKKNREESLDKHYPLPFGLSESELTLVAQNLRDQLKKDQPDFLLQNIPDARNEVDLIISQVPEDYAIWKLQTDKEWLALIHLSCPNHWDAREKVGREFNLAHLPIPHMANISKAAPKLFEQVLKRGAMERFAWGVATDDRLNHHPEPAPGFTQEQWQGRSFDENNPKLFIRLERQTLSPVNHELLGFTIKTSFVDVSKLPANEKKSLADCLIGMDDALLNYKGLVHDQRKILNWLSQF